MIDLVPPDAAHLPAYVAALRAGWSPDTTRDVCAEQLAAIAADPAMFLAGLWRTSPGRRTLPDGSAAVWLPGRTFWLWDGEFCGSINVRHQPGTEALPPHVSGHVGYAVVPWKRRRGYASAALRQILPVARELGLRRVLITCDADNEASRHIIEQAGGRKLRPVRNPDRSGIRRLRFWVATG